MLKKKIMLLQNVSIIGLVIILGHPFEAPEDNEAQMSVREIVSRFPRSHVYPILLPNKHSVFRACGPCNLSDQDSKEKPARETTIEERVEEIKKITEGVKVAERSRFFSSTFNSSRSSSSSNYAAVPNKEAITTITPYSGAEENFTDNPLNRFLRSIGKALIRSVRLIDQYTYEDSLIGLELTQYGQRVVRDKRRCYRHSIAASQATEENKVNQAINSPNILLTQASGVQNSAPLTIREEALGNAIREVKPRRARSAPPFARGESLRGISRLDAKLASLDTNLDALRGISSSSSSRVRVLKKEVDQIISQIIRHLESVKKSLINALRFNLYSMDRHDLNGILSDLDFILSHPDLLNQKIMENATLADQYHEEINRLKQTLLNIRVLPDLETLNRYLGDTERSRVKHIQYQLLENAIYYQSCNSTDWIKKYDELVDWQLKKAQKLIEDQNVSESDKDLLRRYILTPQEHTVKDLLRLFEQMKQSSMFDILDILKRYLIGEVCLLKVSLNTYDTNLFIQPIYKGLIEWFEEEVMVTGITPIKRASDTLESSFTIDRTNDDEKDDTPCYGLLSLPLPSAPSVYGHLSQLFKRASESVLMIFDEPDKKYPVKNLDLDIGLRLTPHGRKVIDSRRGGMFRSRLYRRPAELSEPVNHVPLQPDNILAIRKNPAQERYIRLIESYFKNLQQWLVEKLFKKAKSDLSERSFPIWVNLWQNNGLVSKNYTSQYAEWVWNILVKLSSMISSINSPSILWPQASSVQGEPADLPKDELWVQVDPEHDRTPRSEDEEVDSLVDLIESTPSTPRSDFAKDLQFMFYDPEVEDSNASEIESMPSTPRVRIQPGQHNVFINGQNIGQLNLLLGTEKTGQDNDRYGSFGYLKSIYAKIAQKEQRAQARHILRSVYERMIPKAIDKAPEQVATEKTPWNLLPSAANNHWAKRLIRRCIANPAIEPATDAQLDKVTPSHLLPSAYANVWHRIFVVTPINSKPGKENRSQDLLVNGQKIGHPNLLEGTRKVNQEQAELNKKKSKEPRTATSSQEEPKAIPNQTYAEELTITAPDGQQDEQSLAEIQAALYSNLMAICSTGYPYIVQGLRCIAEGCMNIMQRSVAVVARFVHVQMSSLSLQLLTQPQEHRRLPTIQEEDEGSESPYSSGQTLPRANSAPALLERGLGEMTAEAVDLRQEASSAYQRRRGGKRRSDIESGIAPKRSRTNGDESLPFIAVSVDRSASLAQVAHSEEAKAKPANLKKETPSHINVDSGLTYEIPHITSGAIPKYKLMKIIKLDFSELKRLEELSKSIFNGPLLDSDAFMLEIFHTERINKKPYQKR